MKVNYSRVLIVNAQSLYEDNATGITLRSMFRNWPNERVLEVCFLKPQDPVQTDDLEICSLLMPNYSRPLDWLFRNVVGSWMSPLMNHSIVDDQRQGNEQRVEKKETVKEIVRGILDVSPLLIGRNKLLRIVNEFRPDVVYTMGGAIYPLRLALFFSERYDCNIVLHCMDNWRDTLYTSSVLMHPAKRMLDHSLYLVEQKMKVGLAISNKMVHEYTMRTGCTYKAIMNSVRGPLSDEPMLTNNSAIVFTYAGGMHLNRWKPLLEIQKCIKVLCERGTPAYLYIYTKEKDRDKYESFFDPSTTKFMGFLDHDRLHEAYQQSDVLVHVESFSRRAIQYILYSVSTKIPEYMASGKPILCFAPPNVAVYEYINETGAGIAVSDVRDLFYWVERLSKSPELRLAYAKNGLRTVVKSHTEKVVGALLEEALSL